MLLHLLLFMAIRDQSVPQKECRAHAKFDNGDAYKTEWISCKVAEDDADEIDEPGAKVWIEERSKIGDEWSTPVSHGDPIYIVDRSDYNRI